MVGSEGGRHAGTDRGAQRDRVRVVLTMRVHAGAEREFEDTWRTVAEVIAAAPGNLGQALARDVRDAQRFIVTTDWESREAFSSFERSGRQDALTAPLRAMRESVEMQSYDLRALVPARPEPDATPIRVVVFVRIRAEDGPRFEEAFAEVRRRVAGSPGYIDDELLRDPAEPGRYLLIGSWRSRADFLAWEDDPQHREHSAPMRPYWRDAEVERRIFEVGVGGDARMQVAGQDAGEGG